MPEPTFSSMRPRPLARVLRMILTGWVGMVPVAPMGGCKSESAPPSTNEVRSPAPPAAAMAEPVVPEAAAPPAPEPPTAEAPAEPAAAEPAPAPAPATPRKVLILGDSLAATGFGALLERKLDAHPQVVCNRKAKSASGLARPDFFDWIAEAERQVDHREPDLVVVILGGNDGQDLTPRRGGGARVKWESEGWEAAYRTRIEAFLSAVSAPGRKLLWLGLPRMGMRSLERKLELIRGLQREVVENVGEGAAYLDTSPFFTDGAGALLDRAAVGRRTETLRAEDGVHLTMAGSEYFADKVYPEVLGALELPPAP